ncbi:MAG: STAS domain-containing protein [Planctomycetes bacterium]|nr:STAS domain-containing protein [Planctomycetota bacterium]
MAELVVSIEEDLPGAPGVAVLSLAGAVQVADYPELEGRMKKLARAGKRRLAIDLANIRFMNEPERLLRYEGALRKVGGALVLLNVPAKLRVVFQTLEIDKRIAIRGNLSDAVSVLSDGQPADRRTHEERRALPERRVKTAQVTAVKGPATGAAGEAVPAPPAEPPGERRTSRDRRVVPDRRVPSAPLEHMLPRSWVARALQAVRRLLGGKGLRAVGLLLALAAACPGQDGGGPVTSWDFSRGAEGWSAPLGGKLSVEGGSLVLRYDQVTGEAYPVCVQELELLPLTRAVRFRARTTHVDALFVALQERDGSSYVREASVQRGKWREVSLSISGFELDWNGKGAEAEDENDALDPEQITRFLIGDPTGFYHLAWGKPQGQKIATGAELRLDDVAFEAGEESATAREALKYLKTRTLLGVHANPARDEASDEAYLDMFTKLDRLDSEILRLGNDWKDLEPAPGKYAWPERNSVTLERERRAQGLRAYYELKILDREHRANVPEDIEKLPLSEVSVGRRYVELVLRYVERFGLGSEGASLLVGNEVDAYFEARPEDREVFRGILRTLREKLAERFPEVGVGVTFRMTSMEPSRLADLVSFLHGDLDWIGFTYYKLPSDDDRRTPREVFTQMDELADGLPVYVTEIGMPTSAEIGGSEELQARFVRDVLAEVSRNPRRLAALLWFDLHDLSEETARQLGDAIFGRSARAPGRKEFQEMFRTLGLYRSDGSEKPAVMAWIESRP